MSKQKNKKANQESKKPMKGEDLKKVSGGAKGGTVIKSMTR